MANPELSTSFVGETERARALANLLVIERDLSLESDISSSDRVDFQIERIWLLFKLGMISSEDRETSLINILNDLETNDPVNYDRLTKENEKGATRLAEIRDKVIPRLKVGVIPAKKR